MKQAALRIFRLFYFRRLSFWQIHMCTHSVSLRLTELCVLCHTAVVFISGNVLMCCHDTVHRIIIARSAVRIHSFHKHTSKIVKMMMFSVLTLRRPTTTECGRISFFTISFFFSAAHMARSSTVNSKWSSLRLSFFRDARKCSVRSVNVIFTWCRNIVVTIAKYRELIFCTRSKETRNS